MFEGVVLLRKNVGNRRKSTNSARAVCVVVAARTTTTVKKRVANDQGAAASSTILATFATNVTRSRERRTIELTLILTNRLIVVTGFRDVRSYQCIRPHNASVLLM